MRRLAGAGLTLLLAGCGGSTAAASPVRSPAPIVVSATSTPGPTATPAIGRTIGRVSAGAQPAAATPVADAQPAANQVRIQDFGFGPPTLNVAAGTRVTWTNSGPSSHTVTANDGSFDSGQILPNARFELTFSKPGTVGYHCTFHPTMAANVVVS
jgi:plastocyanin